MLPADEPIDVVLADLDEMVTDNLSGTQRVVRIVNDLLGFARNEPDKIENVNLNDVVTDALKLVRKQLVHSAKLSTQLAEVPMVEGDSGRLIQVVTNLLVNAAHAVAQAKGDKRISLTTATRGRSVFLTVEDSGCGIPSDELERIFDAFYTTKDRGVGTGLGLSLSASIIRVHGGAIEVNSKEGVGTKVIVQLPQAGAEKRIRNVTPIRIRRQTHDHAKPRILIIDDEAALLRSMRRVLSSQYSISTAAGGAEALELLADSCEFDAIFCDVMMPEVDGPMLYHRVIAQEPQLAERFVFCTGGAFTSRAREFLESVDAPCAQKPLSLERIRDLIDSILHSAKQASG